MERGEEAMIFDERVSKRTKKDARFEAQLSFRLIQPEQYGLGLCGKDISYRKRPIFFCKSNNICDPFNKKYMFKPGKMSINRIVDLFKMLICQYTNTISRV